MRRSIGTGPGMLLAAALTIITVQCASFTDSSANAESFRVTVTGTSAVALTLVTSTDFVSQETESGPMVTLTQADTASLALPIDRSVSLRGKNRLYVQLRNPSTTQDATVEMRITIDGREVYRQPATIRDGDLIFLYFLSA